MGVEVLLPLILGALVAGALMSLGAYDAARSLPRVAGWLDSTMKPLRRAGDEGYLPDRRERLRLIFLATGLVLAATVFVAGVGPAMLLAAAGPSAVLAVISRRRNTYRDRVEKAVPDLAGAIADALAGGASLQRALIEAGGSLDGPVAAEFSRVRVDLGLGITARESLRALSARVRSQRVDALVVLLTSASESGGDLILLLRRFGAADLARQMALKDAGSATAQARYTGMLVVALPAGAALFAELVRPGFFEEILGNPASAILLVLAGLLQVVGLLLVKKIAGGVTR